MTVAARLDSQFPAVIRPSRDESFAYFTAKGHWREYFARNGAVLFRGFNVSNVDMFRTVALLLMGPLKEYQYDSTPRTDLGAGIYTSTERASTLQVALHNECSYRRLWPRQLLFGCLQAAEHGGETLLASTMAVTNHISVVTRRRFETLGVMYVRNYWPRLDLPWQRVFHTDSRLEVERACEREGMSAEWIGDDRLRTTSVAQGLWRDPLTKVRLWFNQAHTYHASTITPDIRAALLSLYREDGLPRNAYYGDGSRIDNDTIAEICHAYQRETIACQWQTGDVLLLDNVRVAHGRAPYTGLRTVVVAMS